MENPISDSSQNEDIWQLKLEKKKTVVNSKGLSKSGGGGGGGGHVDQQNNDHGLVKIRSRLNSVQLPQDFKGLALNKPPKDKKRKDSKNKLRVDKHTSKRTKSKKQRKNSTGKSSSSTSSNDEEGKILNQRKLLDDKSGYYIGFECYNEFTSCLIYQGLLPKDLGMHQNDEEDGDSPQAQHYAPAQNNHMNQRNGSLFEIQSESEDETENNNQTINDSVQTDQRLGEDQFVETLTTQNGKKRRASHIINAKTKSTGYFTSPDQLARKLKTLTGSNNNKITPKKFDEQEGNSIKADSNENNMKQIKFSDTIGNPSIKKKASSKSQKQLVDGNTDKAPIEKKSFQVKTQMKELMKKYLNRTNTIQKDLVKIHTSNDNAEMLSAKRKSRSRSPSPNKSAGYNKLTYQESQNEQDLEISFSNKRKLNLILRVNDSKRIKWDLFVMILAIYNCFTLPIDVSLQPDMFQNRAFNAFNYFIDVVFMMDLLLNFRTTYFNPRTGDEVSDPKMIAITYLKTRFWMDLIAAIPFDDLVSNFLQRKIAHKFQLFSLIKVLRVVRVGRIITYMNATDDIKLSLKLLKLCFFLLMFIHFQGCTWFYLVQLDKVWLPQYQSAYNIQDYYEQSDVSKYWGLFYISCQMLVGNDVLPYGNLQVAFASLFLICGALMNAHILGSIAVVVSTMNRKASKFQEQIDIANTAMRNMKLSEDLQWKVQDFMMYTQSNLDNQKELDIFLNMISPSLRLEVIQHIFLNSIKLNELFRGQPEIIDFIVNNIVTLLYLPEDFIIKQGQKGHHFFFLAKGDCEVWVKDQFKREVFVQTLCSGKLFGEVALIASTKRTATIKSVNYCTLAALTKENFYEMCKLFPDTFFRLKYATTQYTDKWKMFQKRMLHTIDYLSKLSDDLIEELHYMMNLEYFEENRVIFYQGSPCKAIYFVVQGELDLYIEQSENEPVLLDTLYQGCSVGSYSVINNQRFPYSAKSKTTLTLLSLPAKVFTEAKEYIDELEFALWEADEYIQANGVPLCDYKMYRNHLIKLQGPQTPLKRFQEAARRVTILNQRHQLKHFKIFDVLQKVQDNYQKESQYVGRRQKTTVFQSRLPPFLQKNFVDKIRNKTASGVLQKTDEYVKRLTVKIEQLTNTVNKQQHHLVNMQKSFNNQMTFIANSQRSSKGFESSMLDSQDEDDSISQRQLTERGSSMQQQMQMHHENSFHSLRQGKKRPSQVYSNTGKPQINFLTPNRINDFNPHTTFERNKKSNESHLVNNNRPIIKPSLKQSSGNSKSNIKDPKSEQSKSSLKSLQIQETSQILDDNTRKQNTTTLDNEQWDTGATAQKKNVIRSTDEPFQSVDESVESSQKSNKKMKVIINFADMENASNKSDMRARLDKVVHQRSQTNPQLSINHLRQDSQSTAVMSSHHQRINSNQSNNTIRNANNLTELQNSSIVASISIVQSRLDDEVEKQMDDILEMHTQELNGKNEKPKIIKDMKKSKTIRQVQNKDVDNIQEVAENQEVESYFSEEDSDSKQE